MVFKRVLGSLGVGGPVVDTVLDRGPVRPGGVVRGQVRLRGGGSGCDIEHLALELVARVETGPGGEEHKGGVIEEHEGGVVFDRLRLSGGSGSTRESTEMSRSPFTYRGKPRSPSCPVSRWAPTWASGPSSRRGARRTTAIRSS